MSTGDAYYDHIYLKATLLDSVGGSAISQLKGSPSRCVLWCYFFNYFGFPASIFAKATMPQRTTGLVFKRTSDSEAEVEALDVLGGDYAERHEELEAQQPRAGTERIAIVVESYDDTSTGASHQPFTGPPIGLTLSVTP